MAIDEMCVEVLLSGLFSRSPVRDEPVPLFGGLASSLVSRFVRRISHRKRILSSPVNLRLLSGPEISRFGALHRHWVGGRVEGGSATLTQPIESAPLHGRPSHSLFTLPVGMSPKLTIILRDLARDLPVSAKWSDYSEERARGMMYISPCSSGLGSALHVLSGSKAERPGGARWGSWRSVGSAREAQNLIL